MRVSVPGADHGAAEGSVLRQDAGSLGLRAASRSAMRFGTLGAKHHLATLVAGHAVTSWQSTAMGCAILFL